MRKEKSSELLRASRKRFATRFREWCRLIVMKPQDMIAELTAAKVKLREIAEECGFSTPSMVHDLKSGRRTNCSYDQGTKLAALHRRVMRRAKAAERS
jgi:AraC-like DNA-binding protein